MISTSRLPIFFVWAMLFLWRDMMSGVPSTLPANFVLLSILREMRSITRISNGDLAPMDPTKEIAI